MISFVISTITACAASHLRAAQEAKGIVYVPEPETRLEKTKDGLVAAMILLSFAVPAIAFTGWVVVMA